MATHDDRTVLCGASFYDKKFYFNEEFASLPQTIKEELRVLCVLFTAKVGGILTLVYEEDGTLEMEVSSKENDFFFDEVGSGLEIRKIQREKKELLESLEMFYRVFVLNESADE